MASTPPDMPQTLLQPETSDVSQTKKRSVAPAAQATHNTATTKNTCDGRAKWSFGIEVLDLAF